mmetsp:Transcript_71913/g.199363  ORF Transcript_71913/g.199363 Transcript_71913/m.199363 type:complete len:218 (+) Transcript_71913:2-655(+)
MLAPCSRSTPKFRRQRLGAGNPATVGYTPRAPLGKLRRARSPTLAARRTSPLEREHPGPRLLRHPRGCRWRRWPLLPHAGGEPLRRRAGAPVHEGAWARCRAGDLRPHALLPEAGDVPGRLRLEPPHERRRRVPRRAGHARELELRALVAGVEAALPVAAVGLGELHELRRRGVLRQHHLEERCLGVDLQGVLDERRQRLHGLEAEVPDAEGLLEVL